MVETAAEMEAYVLEDILEVGPGEGMEKGLATQSSILAWKILWTEEPGGLQSMGSQRVRHD